MSEIDRLAKWILENCPEDVDEGIYRGGEGPVDVAIRLIRECQSRRVTAKAGKAPRNKSKPEIAAAIMHVCTYLINEVNRDSAITITLQEDMRPYGSGFIRRNFLHGRHLDIQVEYDNPRPILEGGDVE